MKKLLKVLAVAIFAFTPFIISSSASAQPVCQIGYTGPDSQNLCKSETKYKCSVTNVNDVKIVNENDQEVASGTVGNSGNTQGGNATSGSVTNSNGATFAVTITNPTTCVAVAVVPATEEPETPVTPTTPTPVQPTVPGNGGGAGTGGGGSVALLPETSGSITSNVLIIVASSLAALSVLGVSGVALYRYYKSL